MSFLQIELNFWDSNLFKNEQCCQIVMRSLTIWQRCTQHATIIWWGITPLIQLVQLRLLISLTHKYERILVCVKGMKAGLAVPNTIALA